MKPLSILLKIATFIAIHAIATAADPAWWTSRGVKNASPASNLSPATIGQAKWMASQALAELASRLPPAEYQALEAAVAAVADLSLPQNQVEFANQRAVLLEGQLKALSKPFYDCLRTLDPAWVNLQMYLANTRVLELGNNTYNYSPYPWTSDALDDSNFSVATVGQLKAVFSLPLESWNTPSPSNPALPAGASDMDGDGLSDVTEVALGTNPWLADTDRDGYNDGDDYYPLDPTRWSRPEGSSEDFTAPLIHLIEPASAVPIP